MRSNSLDEISNLLYQIEKTDRYLEELYLVEESINSTVLNGFLRRKKKLVKKLLLEMLSGGINLDYFSAEYEKILAYLKIEDAKETVPEEQARTMHQIKSLSL